MASLFSWFTAHPSTFTKLSEIKFYVHDQQHVVKVEDADLETTLNEYLRQTAHLTATKNMCFEGGCGTCIVAATAMDPVTNKEVTFAVNSCLIPLYSCSGWKIHTAEAIGDQKNGFHPVQKALVQFNGTQCGFCSSGMVMNMYAMYETGNFTMMDIDNSFGGNICRCTGYRPILAAFKSLASDASSDVIGNYADIEDIPICKKTQKPCQSLCATPCYKKSHYYALGKSKWMKVFSINEVLDVMREDVHASYMLVGGNTATGVYKRTKNPDVYIDVGSVKDLMNHQIQEDKLVVGANMSLTNAMALFYKLSKENPKFSYLEKLGDHIDLIANVPVRNTGTLAGNIFTKHEYHEFPSDIFLMFETAGATVQIVGVDKQETTKTLAEFLSFDMEGKIIKSFTLPALDPSYKYESYKIMPRAQNAHAIVNAGFLLKLNPNNEVESARIVYGNINPDFIHAEKAEKYLMGKQLFSNETLQGLFAELEKEINPDHVLPDPDPDFRRKLAIALCYKFILSIAPDDKISPRNKSGRFKQNKLRPVSKGTQDYETNKSLYPLTQPIPKLEALAQCTGQAEYIFDKPNQPGQLFAAFVLAKSAPNSVISNIDTSEALAFADVVAYYDKNDIPGKNTFMPKEANFSIEEELYCSGVVKYYFQPIGIIVAKTQKAAETAANLVKISYNPGKEKPLMTVRDILASDNKEKIQLRHEVKAKSKGKDIKHVIKGQFDIFAQYHYYMEAQCCIVIPTEDGLDVFPTTQSMDTTQVSIATVLNVPVNKVNITVRRLGGAYGGKVTRPAIVACSAALAAQKLKAPVKFWVPLIDNANVMGKRYGCTANYEVGVDDKGVVQYLNTDVYTDYGYAGGNEYINEEMVQTFMGTYDSSTWSVKSYIAQTDTPTGTWCRAPGTTEALALAESIMDHIASELKLDPLEVRMSNVNKSDTEMNKHISDLMQWAEVDKRKKEVEEFNKANRWVKRGISVVPMNFALFYFGNWSALVSIYQGDGSVAVCHAGVEMGQGINTKVAQVCAYELGIPLEQVSIKPSNTTTTPNSFPTAGSITSEAICYAIIKACEILKNRMEPIKKKMNNPTWKELVKQCYMDNVELVTTSMFHAALPGVKPYHIYGVTCAEVEVDILTGNQQVRRLDILEDTGNSISPEVDIGQVEGAFMMGIGYWTSEQIVYGPEGELLTNRTWNYKPPGAKDIPVDFRVKFPKNNPNPNGILKSKATAEPPQNMACSVPLAIRAAVNSARAEVDPKLGDWIRFNGPSTVQQTFQESLQEFKQYTL